MEFINKHKATRKYSKDKDVSMETEWFTEQNLETSQNELTRNISSKSNILAPFNSTYSEVPEKQEIKESMMANRNVVKFAAKVKDIDRQYEKNNNCELDNGVYNKLMGDSSESKEKNKKELDPLESNEENKIENNKDEFEEIKAKERLSPEEYNKYVNPKTEAEKVSLLNTMVSKPFIVGI